MSEKQLVWNWLSQYDELEEEEFEAIDAPEEELHGHDVHVNKQEEQNEQIK